MDDEEAELQAIRAKYKRKREQEEEEARKKKRDSSLTKEDVWVYYESIMSLMKYILTNTGFVHSQVAEIVRECIKPLKEEIQSVKETVTSFRASDADTSATSEKLP